MPSEERGRLLTCPEWRKLCLGRQNNFLALPQNNPGVLLGLKLSKSKCHCGWPPAGHPGLQLVMHALHGESWKPQ